VRSGRLRAEWTTSLVFTIPAAAMSSRIGARAVPNDPQQNDPKAMQNAERTNIIALQLIAYSIIVPLKRKHRSREAPLKEKPLS